MPYRARTFDHLKRLRGFSDQLMKSHLGLYQGYVKNTNHLATVLLNKVKLGKTNTIEYAEMKRRFGWEFNGMRLHELYFENLSPRLVPPRKASPLHEKIRQDFGQFGTWERGFMGVGGMRVIGWAALTCDPVSGRLFNVWLDEHDAGFPANAVRYCLKEGGVSISDMSYVCFYEKPLLKFERLLETYRSSPLGDLVAEAETKGYDQAKMASAPFLGYHFRILAAQGPAAPGGKKSYVVNGDMSGGFALVAYPAKYAFSGVMTFVVNQDGIIYEKDLGEDCYSGPPLGGIQP